jgi:GNAT superfamily N-acetyltransferase
MEKQPLNPEEERVERLGGPGLEFIPLSVETIPTYLQTGREAYVDHYCHLWPGADPNPYLKRNFTRAILREELKEPRYECGLITHHGAPAGIYKIDLQKECNIHPTKAPLFLEKIYFRKSFTGQGLGEQAMGRILTRSKILGKDFIWLKTMQKGPALNFYKKQGFEILGETQIPYPEVLEAEKQMWVLGRPVL